MAEQVDLTTPAGATTPHFRIVGLALYWEQARIVIELLGDNGVRRSETYDGQVARDLMGALNKANLTLKSLHRRVLERLIADGRIAGSISGTPD